MHRRPLEFFSISHWCSRKLRAGCCFGGERVVIGKIAAAGADRWSSIEPREECEFLHMIGEAAKGHGWEKRPAQRIANLEVVLTTTYLAYVSPSGSRIVAERIV